jgi:hypothetical protein
MAPIAIPFVLVEGLDRVANTGTPWENVAEKFENEAGDEFMQIGAGMFAMSFATGKRAAEGLEEGVDEGVKMWKGRVWDSAKREFVAVGGYIGEAMRRAGALGRTGAFSDAFKGWQTSISGAISSPVEEEFDDAVDEVRIGFGNIKSALANPPQIISKDDRLENMAGRFRKIMKNLNQAVEVDDPYNKRYWAEAALAQQRRMNQISGNTEGGVGRIMRIFNKAGIEVDRDWVKMQLGADRTKGKVEAAGDAIDGLPSRTTPTVDVNVRGGDKVADLRSDLFGLPNVISTTVQAVVQAVRRQHGGAVQAGRAYVVGEVRPEMFIPTQPGRIEPRVSSGAIRSGGGGGGAPPITIQTYGLPMRAETPLEVAMQTARAARLGYFAPRQPALGFRGS